jgi:hypothetical protein
MRSGSGWEVIADPSVVFESAQASGVRDARKQRFVESFGFGHLRRMAEARKFDELGAADRPPSPIRIIAELGSKLGRGRGANHISSPSDTSGLTPRAQGEGLASLRGKRSYEAIHPSVFAVPTLVCFAACHRAALCAASSQWRACLNLIPLSSPICQKYSASPFAQIKSRTRAVSPHRGAYRDRHGRGAGCGGRGSVGRATGWQGGFFGACERSQAS